MTYKSVPQRKNVNVSYFFHLYEIYAKSSKTEAANEDQWQKFNMKYLPRHTRAVESHVLLPSVMGDKHRVQQWDAGAEGAKDMKFPLKSVLPVHVEDWQREVAEGMLSIFWGHIKVCSMGSHWPEVL